MSDQNNSTIHLASEHGTAGSHPSREGQPLRFAPTTAAQFNTVAQDLVPVACMSLHDIAFEFGSSFVKPAANGVNISNHLSHLPDLRQAHRNAQGQLPLLSVFGHADPVGPEEFNKHLSGRRAKAVYGLLTHNTDIWNSLYNNPCGEDDWQANGSVRIMRDFLGDGAPVAGAELFKAYMAALNPTQLQKTDFLGRGKDPGGKADYQGCGKFNPLLVFSKEKDKYYAEPKHHLERNAANQPNRRVVIYLFSPNIVLNSKLWPCARAIEPAGGCRVRSFSNAAQRRAPGDEQREFKKTKDTFACRFYDRVAHDSPCEAGGDMEWLLITLLDAMHNPRPAVPYVLKAGGMIFRRKTDTKGQIAHLVPRASREGTLQFEGQQVTLNIEHLPAVEELAGVQMRLRNLGYDCGTELGSMNDKTHESIRGFQELHKLTVNGEPDSDTASMLKQVYGH